MVRPERKASTIPVAGAAGAGSHTGTTVPTGSSCPQCRAEMGPADVLCLHCGYHKERGAQLRTVVSRHVAYCPPRDFQVEERGSRLIMTRGPALKGGLPAAIGVLVVGLGVVGVAWKFYPIAAGVLLALFLLVYLAAIYRLSIVVDPQRILVRHEPFFWLPRTILVADIDQLYCRKRTHFSRRTQSEVYTYDACILTKSGRRTRMVSRLPVENHALFFEERIERFLGITDRDVEASFLESYDWVLRFVIALVFAIAALIASLVLR